jgi:hypothetical protein
MLDLGGESGVRAVRNSAPARVMVAAVAQFHKAHEFLQIVWNTSGNTEPARLHHGWRRFSVASAAVAVAALAAATGLAWVHFREREPLREILRFELPAPERNFFRAAGALSPDGKRLAFAARPPIRAG